MALITFSDICIDDQYSEITSRSNVDISTDLCGIMLSLPVIASNMPNICEYKMAIEMANNGGLGILHRFMSIKDNVNQYQLAISNINMAGNPNYHTKVGVSIGVKDGEKERFDKLYEAGARIFCIDIAHGNCLMMKEMIGWIRSRTDNSKTSYKTVIIAGNIANAYAALNLAEWGADIEKIGIGPGSVCTTRKNTGVGKPQFSALKEVHEALEGAKVNVKIISDGGIKTSGDCAKALIYADAVMVGAVLAGTSETPGSVYPVAGTDLTNRQYYKTYGGSSSMENKVLNHQGSHFVEGEMKTIPFKGHAKYLLREIKEGLQSSFSYCGASNLKEFKQKVKWDFISGGGKTESKI